MKNFSVCKDNANRAQCKIKGRETIFYLFIQDMNRHAIKCRAGILPEKSAIRLQPYARAAATA